MSLNYKLIYCIIFEICWIIKLKVMVWKLQNMRRGDRVHL